MQSSKDAALRKRTQIASANRTMFIWIACASALVGFAAVASIFLAQKLVFNEKVLAEKNATITTLNQDNKAVPALEQQLNVLDTNTDLASVKASPDDENVQVILDALPSDTNSFALGASLQQNLLANIPGLTIDTLQVTPVAGVENLGDDGDDSTDTTDTSAPPAGADEIDFHAVLSGSQTSFKQALQNFEKSIRTIDVTDLHITSAGTTLSLTIDGRGFYEPAVSLQLENKVVKP